MSDAGPQSSSRIRAASTVVGAVLALAAVVFVAKSLIADREEIADALGEASLGWVAVAVALAAVGMTAIAVPWRHAIRLLGADMPMRQIVSRYYLGEIGKYLPGGVWPVLGRGELAVRGGVRRVPAYSSVLLSLLALYLAAMIVVLVGMPVLLSGDDGSGPVVVLALLPLGLAALHPKVLGFVVDGIERLTRRRIQLEVPTWRASVALVARYLPAWTAIGAATWAVSRALDPNAEPLHVGVAAVLSWLIGFVLVPVPGGVGVREAAFVAAAGSLDPGIAAAVAVGARAIFVAVDAVGAVLGALALRSGSASAAGDLTGSVESEPVPRP